jgi:oxygen-independent coproporphyrinogen-3 oxidase
VRHLYLHVPFCRRRCSYCDFSIAVRRRVPAADYLACITAERRLAGLPGPPGTIETLYLGGGTPSLLPPEALAELLRGTLGRAADGAEVTLEANPEDVTPAAAAAWRRAGVNRVSLGAQSFDDGVLRWMHRPHDADRIGAAVATLRGAGMANVSLDLSFALPAALERDWARDLDRVVALAPEHLSLYGLTVEPRTPLERWIARGTALPPDDERYATEYLLAHERLGAAGYQFYEVSNAARPGFRSRHNSAYGAGRPYAGLGPAAHSFDGRARRWNLRAWEAYRRAVAQGRSPIESEEVLTAEERRLERLYLGLRTEAGLALAEFDAPLPPSAAAWLRQGWVTQAGDRLRCTPEGWLRLDALVGDLTQPRLIT